MLFTVQSHPFLICFDPAVSAVFVAIFEQVKMQVLLTIFVLFSPQDAWIRTTDLDSEPFL